MRPLAITATLLALTLAGPAHARNWLQSYDVTGQPHVQVITNDGHVRVHTGPAGKVSVNVLYEVHTWGLKSGAHEPEVMFEHSGVNQVSITARSKGYWVMFGGISERFEIDVTVPAECNLEVTSGDGAVDVEPLAGQISLTTGDGRLRATGLRGTLRLRSGDGGIDATGLDGNLSARTGDGHLVVYGRFDQLDLRTGDGRLEASATRGSKLATDWNLETGDGSLLLRIPRNLQAMLDAHTGDGHIHVDLPVSVSGGLSGHDLRGQLNGGTIPLRMRTADGSLSLGLAE